MDIKAPEYVSLDHLAGSLGLPKRYLAGLAESGAIPALRAGHRMRFRVDEVSESLRELARRSVRQDPQAEGEQ